MWSDELDKKIKVGSENYQPAYNGKDWDKMELLLEKHLPHKKKRRRFILWLFPLAMVGTGLFFLVQQQSDNKIGAEKNTVTSSVPANEPVSKKADIVRPTDPVVSGKDIDPPIAAFSVTNKDGVDENILQAQPVTANRKNIQHADWEKIKKATQINRLQSEIEPVSPLLGKNRNNKKTLYEDVQRSETSTGQNSLVTNTDKQKTGIVTDVLSPNQIDTAPKDNIAAKQQKQADSIELKEAINNTKTGKPKRSSGSKLSFYLSAGPDISSIGIDKPGKLKLQYGIGAGYELSERLTVRAGFFVGRKIYSADSTEYHDSYYPPKLQRIDANCLVYEIPVNLVYNFPAVKKHNWFVAGGLSSYLMKEESYDYFYKNAWGQPQHYSHSYKNENSHIFSVINISGGYKYNFTDRFSLMAEPYVRIPVNGIGSGKVKLNSGGVLFSIAVKPFLKRN